MEGPKEQTFLESKMVVKLGHSSINYEVNL